MKPISYLLSTFLLFCFIPLSILTAQSPFKAGAIIGVNFAQIDGDYQYGYDKLGKTFGLRGGFKIHKKWDIMTELLYIEKGTRPNDGMRFDARKATINYKYAEVPLLINYHARKTERGFYQWTLYSGVSYGRLLRATSTISKKGLFEETVTNSVSQNFLSKHDFSFLIGLNYNIIPNLAIGIRHSVALNKVYNNPNPERTPTGNLVKETYFSFRNYYIAIQLQYDIIAPKIVQKKPKTSVTPTRRSTSRG